MPRYDDRYGGTRLYVGRLSSRTRSRDLEDIFARYGRIRDVDMKRDFAFVEFSDPRDADDARYSLNGRDVDGSRIIVEFARGAPRGPGGSREYLGRGPPPGQGRCFNCGIDGHWARDCKAGDWKNKCYRCGERGHIERNCQNSPKKLRRGRSYSRSPSPRRGRSRSRSYSRGRSESRSRSPVKRERSMERFSRRSRSPRDSRSPKRRRGSPRPPSKGRNRSLSPGERSPLDRGSLSPRDRRMANGSDYSGSPRGRSRSPINDVDGPEDGNYRSPREENGRRRVVVNSITKMALNLSRSYPSFARPSPFVSKARPSIKLKISCFAPRNLSKCRKEYTSVMIVPTGVGATIGGFAGDALPVARALSSVVDCLITHPNVLNAAMLYWPMPNVLYVEGYALDRFAEGLWALKPVHQNKVGLVLDAGIEEDLRIRHLQVADAARASLGLPVVECVVTDTPLKVEKWVDPESGQSTGRIGNPNSLLRAVHNLIERAQVNAVAVVGRFPDDDVDDVDDYRQGMGIDVLAGVEAVISHLVVQELRIPCAHAPALSPLPLTKYLSPKSAAEEIGYTFLPCVLAGLSLAPQYLIKNSEYLEKDCILGSDVDSVVLPVDACGGDGVLAFAWRKGNKPLMICVDENGTVLNDTPDKLGIEAVKVSNYWEAIGVIAAHKAGIDPHSLRRNRIDNIQCSFPRPANGTAVSSMTSIKGL